MEIAMLIGGVTPDIAIYAEESFGPAEPITRVLDDQDAIQVATDTACGPTAAVIAPTSSAPGRSPCL